MDETVLRVAAAHLRRRDVVLAAMVRAVGPCRLRPERATGPFAALVESIVYQQITGRAAETIHGRLVRLAGARRLRPQHIDALSDGQLREAGLSRQKIGYLRDLAERVHRQELPLDHVETLDDPQLIAHLVQVRGIGRWTAQMFLMFKLGRPDVLPDLDRGIQNAIRRAYRKRKVGPRDVLKIGAKWTPYSSIACWYLWRSLDNG